MEALGELIGFIMTALAFAMFAFIIYICCNIWIKNDNVLWFIRFVLIILWVIASFAIGFPY